MSKRINILVAVIMVILLLWGVFGCKQNTSSTQTLPKGEGLNTEELIWYPQTELYVRYEQDTFRVVAVNIYRRLGMISKGNRQIVRALDSLKIVE